MAFKSKGGFVIRPIVTADSQGGANASIATINSSLATVNSRLTELESKVFPATIVSMNLVKLTDMTFDLTVVFSKTTRQLTGSDLELTSCTASNFRRPSDTTQVITLTATSPVQFSYKIKEDSVAGRFVGSSLQTKIANVYRESGRLDEAGADSDNNFYTSIATIGNPILFGLVRDAPGSGESPMIRSGAYFSIFNNLGNYVGIGDVNYFIGPVDESVTVVLLSVYFSRPSGVPGQFLAGSTITEIAPLPSNLYRIEGYTEFVLAVNWRLVALTKVY